MRDQPVVAAALLALVALPAAAGVVIHVPGDQPTLSAALTAVPHGGTIELAPGSYSAPPGGWWLNNPARSFTIRGEITGTVFLDGSGTCPVFGIQNTSLAWAGHVTFQDLEIRNGLSLANGASGGVTLSRARATFVRVTFRDNVAQVATPGGGGMLAAESIVTLVDCDFIGNESPAGGGGLGSSDSVLWLHRCRFVGNRADVPNHHPFAPAGGMGVSNGTARIGNSRFEANRAGYVGGGLYTIGSWTEPRTVPRADVVVANSTFVDNVAQIDPGVDQPLPTEAGGIHAEDQSLLRLYSSRLLRNSADNGGGLNLYRSRAVVDGCSFRGNRALGTGAGRGFGGAISAISDDAAATPNYPAAELFVSGSLLQGRWSSTGATGQNGACVAVHGDLSAGPHAIDDPSGLPYYRARLTLTDSALVDCDVAGHGGGLESRFADLALARLLVAGSDGTTTEGGAGAFVISTASRGSIADTTVAGCEGTRWGGAGYVSGSDLDISGSAFVHNEVSPGVSETINQSYGAGIFSAQETWSTYQLPQTGVVSTSVFSRNVGVHLFEDDRSTGPVNDWVYNGNTFYGSPFNPYVYFNVLVGQATSSELNGLVVNRPGGVPDTDKSTIANTLAGSVPRVAALLAVPPTVPASGAAGDAGAPEAFLAWAWEGGSAHLDGETVTSWWGLDAAAPGVHQLEVDGLDETAAVASRSPSATFAPASPVITAGQSTSLTWNVGGASFIEGWIDNGVGTLTTTAGSVTVSPTATTTYTFVAITTLGSVAVRSTVYVDEEPVIFADGFGCGSGALWSSAVH